MQLLLPRKCFTQEKAHKGLGQGGVQEGTSGQYPDPASSIAQIHIYQKKK